MEQWKNLINLDTATSFRAVEGGLLRITTYEKTTRIKPIKNEEMEFYDSLLGPFAGQTKIEVSSDMLPFEVKEKSIKNFDSYLIKKVTNKRLIRRIIISNEGINIHINLEALMKIYKDVVGNIDYAIFVPRMSIVYPKRYPFQAEIKTENQ